VAACFSNPFRWRTRRQIANDFRYHMAQSSNAKLHFIEAAFGDRPWDVTGDHEGDIQVRTQTDHLWHKENLLNIAIKHFPPDWRYGAIIDADAHFTRHDWALETVHQLQHYDWVQCYSHYFFVTGHDMLGQGHRPMWDNDGIIYTWVNNGHVLPAGISNGFDGYSGIVTKKGQTPRIGAPGLAWAFRRSAFDRVGGLMDRCILGSADSYMALGLVGLTGGWGSADTLKFTADYKNYITTWQTRAHGFHGNIGYVDGTAIHHWHGPIHKRGYSSRNAILIEEKYEPTYDVYPDWQGVLQLTHTKPQLRNRIRRYFLSRSEDVPHLG
jgi:hypothetical protein